MEKEIIEVSDEIYSKAEKRKENRLKFLRCLDEKICPKCGEDLSMWTPPPSSGLSGSCETLKCNKCNLTYNKQ